MYLLECKPLLVCMTIFFFHYIDVDLSCLPVKLGNWSLKTIVVPLGNNLYCSCKHIFILTLRLGFCGSKKNPLNCTLLIVLPIVIGSVIFHRS